MVGGEIIDNKEIVKLDPDQEAVENIKNAKAEDVDIAVKNKFSNPEKIQEEMKKNKESDVVLKNIQERVAKDEKENPEYKNYIESSYTNDMKTITDQIIAANIGWTEQQKLLSPDAIYRIDPLSVKAWATYVNYTIANDNLTTNTNKKMIETPNLMKCFTEIQDVLLTHTRIQNIPNPTIKFDNTSQMQDTGEFIPVAEQEKIQQGFQNLIDNNQEITGITILGKADATGPNTREMPENQIKKSTTSLLQKGLDPKILITIEHRDGTKIDANLFDGVENMQWREQKNKLNVARAYARALMQIDFLSPDHIQLINKSQRAKIVLDAQPVNLDPNDKENKWPEYTGWGIEITTKGGEMSQTIIEKEPTQELASFNQMQINFVAPTYYGDRIVDTGALRFAFKNGKVNISKDVWANTFPEIQTRAKSWTANSALIEAGGNHFWDGTTINLALDPKDTRLGMADLEQPQTMKPDERKPYYENFSNAIQTYMQSISPSTEAFVGFLQEYGTNTNNPAEKKYIENIIQVVKSYQEIDQKKI